MNPDARQQAWEVHDDSHSPLPVDRITFTISRGDEEGARCWDYGLACLIEAALNMRDGTVE